MWACASLVASALAVTALLPFVRAALLLSIPWMLEQPLPALQLVRFPLCAPDPAQPGANQ